MAHPVWGKQGYAINSPANTLVSWHHSSDCKVAEQEGFMKHELQSGILHVLHTAGLVLGLCILHVAALYLVSCPRCFSVVFWGLQEHVCSLPANAHSISVLQSCSSFLFPPYHVLSPSALVPTSHTQGLRVTCGQLATSSISLQRGWESTSWEIRRHLLPPGWFVFLIEHTCIFQRGKQSESRRNFFLLCYVSDDRCIGTRETYI